MATIFLFELNRWIKSKTVWLVFITWCLLSLFATRDRGHSIRRAAIANDTASRYELKRAADYYLLLDSVEKGQKQIASWSADPRNPVIFNRLVPRFAILEPGALNKLATGQSDVLPGRYLISSRYDYRVQKQEATNGLQALYGKLDMAFVLVMLLPLIIIALNFNILSSEKEKNTLKLLLAQGSTLRQVLTGKLLVSFLFSLLLLVLPVLIANITIGKELVFYFTMTILYSLFWHLLAAFVNSRLQSSAWNATVLLSGWLIFVLIVPALVNTGIGLIHPVPSRTQFITDYRRLNNEAERDSNALVLDKYFFDHPEMVKQDTTGNLRNRANEFYKAVHINQDKTQTALQPLYDKHYLAIRSANQFADKAGLLSPAAILQQSMVLLAGQSSKQYVYFNEQVDKWRKPYLNFVLNKLVQDDAVSRIETEKFKPFVYRPYNYTRQLAINAAVLFLFNAFLVILLLNSLQLKTVHEKV